MSRTGRLGLIVLFAIVPLYGTFAALDPDRPPIPPLVPAPVTVLCGLCTLAALAAIVPAALRALRRDALTFGFLAPGVATLLAGFAGFDPALGIGLGVGVTGVGAVGLALAREGDAVAVRQCLRAFSWSALTACLIALAMVAAHRPAAIYAYDNGRAVGTFLNPNELAAYTLIALGVAVPLAVRTRGRDRLAAACAVAALVTLGATFSRWGALSAVCGVAIYALVSRTRLLLVAAAAVAVVGIGLDVTAGARHHNPRDTEAREVAWQTGLTTFERFPLLGVGPLAYGRTYDVMRPPDAPGAKTAVAFDPHSLPIAFAAEGGIIALVTLTASFVILLGRLLHDARNARPFSRAVALGAGAAVVALTIDGAINTISLYFPLGLQFVALGLAVVRTDAFD
ncbi:MAG TPA: O-antigen ligase family protein [Candidatus Elarobacter sp.]|nr:O-antigen ligase family protein [Candidatus Elarobacter sp.]